MKLSHPPEASDRQAALALYRRRAAVYDLELLPFEPIRRLAIAKLAPRRGETVLDLGCGTGLSFEGLEQAIGAQGTIIGIEQSPEMMALARARVERHGWDNVTLLGASIEAAPLPGRADAALLHFTHDILRSPAALTAIVAHLRPGARVVASGLKWAPWWAGPVNLFVWSAALHSVGSLEGLDAPWSGLAGRIGDLQVQTLMAGGVYIASGVVGTPS